MIKADTTPTTLLSLLVAGVLLSATGCSSDGDETMMTDQFFPGPTSADALRDFLVTRYINNNDFDVWLCTETGSAEPSYAHALPAAGTLGEGLTGMEYTLADGGTEFFTWEAIGSNGIEITYANTGMTVISNNYDFDDEDTWYLDYIDGGSFDCVRTLFDDLTYSQMGNA